MTEARPGGPVYWIDHYAIVSNDLDRWSEFMTNVVGARDWLRFGGGGARSLTLFQKVTRYQGQDCFSFSDPIPPSKGLGKGCPRYGFFIRPEEIETHLRRLDRFTVPHTDPAKTSAEGEEGIVIYWEDPDHNQFEFWAPARMPAGAMDGCGPLNVGRVSHAVYEARDLDRTTDFVTSLLNIKPIFNADVDKHTAPFAMASGGRIVYKRVDQLGERASRLGKVGGSHTALAVRNDDFLRNCERLWEALPEWERPSTPDADPANLPPATAMHGSLAGRTWRSKYGRGDGFFDWDGNSFHFVGAVSRDGMATYRTRFMDHLVQEVYGTRVESELFLLMEEEEARGEWKDILG